MTALKKSNTRSTRKKPKTASAKATKPATRYQLPAKVTPQEKQLIVDYCQKNHLSVTDFLVQLALEDAQQTAKQSMREETITLTLTLPSVKLAKLEYSAKAQEKSVADFIREQLLPNLAKRQTASSLDTETLKYSMTPEQHQIIKAHLEKHELSARHHIPRLALKHIASRSKK